MSFMNNKQGISIKDGFPNAAADTSLDSINLTKLLIPRPVSSFLFKISDCPQDNLPGVSNGDIAIVDRSINPLKNDLVIWWETDGFTISPKHKVPLDTPVWGTITSIIHLYRRI